MSTPSTALETRSARRELIKEQARKIDEAAQAMELFHGAEISTEREILLAMAVVDMRQALTPEVMQPIMALQGLQLGYLTDKDREGGYPVEVVKDVLISCKMIGFRMVGNEVNIIKGKMYPAKAGYFRKLTDGKSFPGLTDFFDVCEIPQVNTGLGGGAMVKCKATWKMNGQPATHEATFAITVNAGMGPDAVIGKAKKKLYQAVHDKLRGASTPEGDIDDGNMKNVTPSGATFGAGGAAAGEGAKDAGTGATSGTVTVDAESDTMTPAQQELTKMLLEAGIEWGDFTDWMAQTLRAKEAKSWADPFAVPDATITLLLADPKAVQKLKLIHAK